MAESSGEITKKRFAVESVPLGRDIVFVLETCTETFLAPIFWYYIQVVQI